ncbi:hypothetical protein G6F45_013979 [Rhizopus arrhizus]|nr:hypothetical protein G6F45_013979 [Rhizopus arrhizus]
MMAKTNTLTVEYLIALTFLGGVGTALMGPTWQAIVPELVPKAELKTAVGLNSLGINIARALGPAVGGLLLDHQGYRATFWFSALLLLGSMVTSYIAARSAQRQRVPVHS